MTDTRPFHYTDEMLHALADKNRPKAGRQPMRPPLKVVFHPARRHRCAICRDIFECGLCRIDADHILHITHGGHTPLVDYTCEPCIEKHELWIATTIHSQKHHWGLYDHLTGEYLGSARLVIARKRHYNKRRSA